MLRSIQIYLAEQLKAERRWYFKRIIEQQSYAPVDRRSQNQQKTTLTPGKQLCLAWFGLEIEGKDFFWYILSLRHLAPGYDRDRRVELSNRVEIRSKIDLKILAESSNR